jgi:hypothetical protein
MSILSEHGSEHGHHSHEHGHEHGLPAHSEHSPSSGETSLHAGSALHSLSALDSLFSEHSSSHHAGGEDVSQEILKALARIDKNVIDIKEHLLHEDSHLSESDSFEQEFKNPESSLWEVWSKEEISRMYWIVS